MQVPITGQRRYVVGRSTSYDNFGTESTRAFTGHPLEKSRKMLWILKSQIIGDFTYVGIGRDKTPFGFCDKKQRDQILRSISCLLFYKIAEITWRQIGFSAK